MSRSPMAEGGTPRFKALGLAASGAGKRYDVCDRQKESRAVKPAEPIVLRSRLREIAGDWCWHRRVQLR